MRLLLALLALLATSSALAQSESSVTLYAGYRFGGHFTDITTGKSWVLLLARTRRSTSSPST